MKTGLLCEKIETVIPGSSDHEIAKKEVPRRL
jgi:hypothetical protein